MIQFTDSEIEAFRNRIDKDAMISILRSLVQPFLDRKLAIPEKGIANWSHYYYCPDCSVELTFNLDEPLDHICPSCGRHFSDEKMNGAWWMLRNTFNANAAYHLGLLYMLAGDRSAASRARDVLLGYAKYYPDYEVHGDIPYNGPGRLNAQTLDESNFLRTMGYAYDLVESSLEESEKNYIKERLFRIGIDFLKANRHSQIHNHEVICNGAVGVLSLILNDYDSLVFAMTGKYGLLYQLEHGVLDDGFWFECSTAYHFYALQNFLLYEKFAKNTAYSNLSHPNYRKMFSAILRLEKSDHSYPLLNDSHIDQGNPDGYSLFEFAYHTWRDPEILSILNEIYKRRTRLSVESFFYGDETLPPDAKDMERQSIEGSDGLGATVIRRGNVYLLFRHGPYGGEHDHYDRLGISYYYDNVPVSIDIGTTGYGATLHYAYYKNTVTHNTVSINDKNQSPSKGTLLSFSEDSDSSDVSASVRWTDGYEMPDSFTIRQWDDEAYRDVYMERHIKVTDEAVLDYLSVEIPEPRMIDHLTHFHGERIAMPSSVSATVLADAGPLSYLHDTVAVESDGIICTQYLNKNIVTSVFSYSSETAIYLSTGPDNPSNEDMSYVIMRKQSSKAEFIMILSSGYVEAPVSDVRISKICDKDYIVTLCMSDGREKSYTIGGCSEDRQA